MLLPLPLVVLVAPPWPPVALPPVAVALLGLFELPLQPATSEKRKLAKVRHLIPETRRIMVSLLLPVVTHWQANFEHSFERIFREPG